MIPTTFKTRYKKILGPSFNKDSEKALDLLLGFLEKDKDYFYDKPSEVAYVIATVWHETWTPSLPRRFVPCLEMSPKGESRYEYFEKKYGWKTKLGKELGNDQPGDGATYFGRGYIQLTGKANYKKMSEKCGYGTLLIHPGSQGHATTPQFAYNIMVTGMRDGDFTGRKFSDYYDIDGAFDFVGAREIVNGRDKAKEIADHAKIVYAFLMGE